VGIHDRGGRGGKTGSIGVDGKGDRGPVMSRKPNREYDKGSGGGSWKAEAKGGQKLGKTLGKGS